jgi:hypothetical protein
MVLFWHFIRALLQKQPLFHYFIMVNVIRRKSKLVNESPVVVQMKKENLLVL